MQSARRGLSSRGPGRAHGRASRHRGRRRAEDLPQVHLHIYDTIRARDQVRLRLRRDLRRRPRAARRQGDRPGGDDAARRAGSRRVHDHDRRLPRLHARGRRCPTGSTTRSRSTSRASRSGPASASATTATRCSSRVRSGAAVSMPGMMDTILNLGLNDDAVEGLARTTGNARFARDSYRRLIQMYGEVVDGVDGHRFEQALGDLKRERGVQQDVDLTRRRPRAARRDVQGRSIGRRRRDDFPQDAREQLRRAVRRGVRVVAEPARAGVPAHVRHRRRHRHRGERRADGVRQQGRPLGDGRLLHARPVDRRAGLYGEYLVNAQGEDVVAGIRTPQPIEEMRERLPEAFDQLIETMHAARAALPRHAGHRVHDRGRDALPPADARRRSARRRPRSGRRSRWRAKG